VGRGLEKPDRKYGYSEGPLHKIGSKRQAADLLGWYGSPKDLERFLRRGDNYLVYTSATGREIQEPKPALERLQRRLANLLVRIVTPDYLHSGTRKRSHVTNGAAHMVPLPGLKVDVHAFYASTTGQHIYRFFLDVLHCPPDVAGLLTNVSKYTRKNCLPTGSCLSQILAFHVHRKMFDAIEAYVLSQGGVLTVYVDDITISMPRVGPSRIRQIGRFIEKQGLRWHKARYFGPGRAKVVTGTVVTSSTMRAPHKHHFKLASAMRQLRMTSNCSPEHVILATRAANFANSIAQVDRRHIGIAKHFRGLAKRETQLG